MKITRKEFPLPGSGRAGTLYTLEAGELRLSLSTLGAAWTSLVVPSRRGGPDDVLLGYASPGEYAGDRYFFGATIGRYANRVGKGRFSLGGKDHVLDRNDGENCLHGGSGGFHARIWDAEGYEERGGVFVRFALESPGGEGGWPGKFRAAVTYGLRESGEVSADYRAELDAPCPANLTNHAYFNLAGAGSVLAHEFVIHASARLEVDSALVPTGKILPVEGGAFDFRRRKAAGRDIAAAGGGYDHCFVLDGGAGTLRPCAEVFEEGSGRSLRVSATQPGVQFYTGNSLDGVPGKAVYGRHGGFCLETQHFPDSPNRPEFPDALFGPRRPYREEARFAFSW